MKLTVIKGRYLTADEKSRMEGSRIPPLLFEMLVLKYHIVAESKDCERSQASLKRAKQNIWELKKNIADETDIFYFIEPDNTKTKEEQLTWWKSRKEGVESNIERLKNRVKRIKLELDELRLIPDKESEIFEEEAILDNIACECNRYDYHQKLRLRMYGKKCCARDCVNTGKEKLTAPFYLEEWYKEGDRELTIVDASIADCNRRGNPSVY